MTRGQGSGWYGESRRHAEAAKKGRPTHSTTAAPPPNVKSRDRADKRYLVFCDGVGRYSFDTPEQADQFARDRHKSRRYYDVEVVDQETDESVKRYG